MRSFYPPWLAVMFVNGEGRGGVFGTMLGRMVVRRSTPYMGCWLVFSRLGCISLTLLQLRKGGLLARRRWNVKTACPSWL
ncbi:hypothetical protein [Dyella japonica]|uniref:hypothetical protein n=1 Tax=Dyella japonica TaxID=231455 RepID=UPI0012E04818|nr:hypothetical protein [Dyella japonica]